MVTIQKINRLINRARKLKAPLPFVAVFKDGRRKNFDGGNLIDMIVKGNTAGLVRVEESEDATGQGMLNDLINGILEVEDDSITGDQEEMP